MTSWTTTRRAQLLVLSATIVSFPACEDESVAPPPCAAGTVGCADATDKLPPPSKPAFDSAFVDRRINPCDDFYRFACGNWITSHPLAEGTLARLRFEEIEAQVETTVTSLLTTAINDRSGADPDNVAMRTTFEACVQAPSQLGLRATLRGLLAPIDRIGSLEDLARQSAELRKLGVETMFLQYTSIDHFEPTRFLLTIDQGARAVPHPALYLVPENEPVRVAYQRYMTTVAGLLGVTLDPAAVLRVETALTAAESPRREDDDPRTREHKLSFSQLTTLAPRFPWKATFEAYGLPVVGEVNARSEAYFKKLDELLGTIPLSDWQHYLRWMLIDAKAPLLDQEIRDQHFAFHGRIVDGEEKAPTISETCAGQTGQRFVGLLANRFVARHFGPAARTQALEITMALRDTFARRIMGLPWLDTSTRESAQTKLANIVAHVGAPQAPPRRPPLMTDFFAADLEEQREKALGIVRSLAQPLDRSTLWIATGLEVNAFYAPQVNSITLPAAFLLPPAFDPSRHPIGNYAALGAVIGHEFTHGFDSAGRFFDQRGALRSWWSEATNTEFETRGACVANFYSGVEARPGKRVNGKFTLGENIADLGGVRMAYETAMSLHGNTPAHEGFDARQQFFLGYGQLWCANLSDRFIDMQLQVDEHAPNPARVFGSLAHLPEFAEAFACPAAAPMRAQPVCSIW